MPPSVTVPLSKQYVPVQRANLTVAYKTAYFGNVYVGLPKPQVFTVVFDTGSAHFLLPSTNCHSETCLRHRRYDRNLSETAVDIDHDGSVVKKGAAERDQVAIDFGTGQVVGEFAQETVCLGPKPEGLSREEQAKRKDCARVRTVLATEMTKDPFYTFEFDGVMGLALESLALNHEFSFFGQMSRAQATIHHVFGVFISRSDKVSSEIAFGGINAQRTESELHWVPVLNPALGYWQVPITGVRVGGESLELCKDGGCVGILDTGTSLLGVPQQATHKLHWLLARKVPGDPAELDCRSFPGPDLVLEVDGFSLTLGPEDYSRAAGMRIHNSKTNATQVACRASLLRVDMGPPLSSKTFILGEPVLRKYYTAYDWIKRSVGFAKSVEPNGAFSEGDHQVIGEATVPSPADVHI